MDPRVKIARCCECHEHKPIRAQGRCHTCYGRFYRSNRFTLVQVPNPVRHRLADIDPFRRRATCSVCGPVGITKCGDYRKVVSWRCNTTRNAQKKALRTRAKAA